MNTTSSSTRVIEKISVIRNHLKTTITGGNIKTKPTPINNSAAGALGSKIEEGKGE